MSLLIYGTIAVFAASLIADVIADGAVRFTRQLTGSDTPVWSEQFIRIARRWGE